MPSAIVTGATGIAGSAIVDQLLKDPSYERIYSFSRRDPGYDDPKIKHVALDLQGSVQEMVKSFKGISAEVNEKLLSNFLEALESTGAAKRIKRFILTCGFKQYGVHIGPAEQRLLEGDPLLEQSRRKVSWPPIFYYDQQRILAHAAKRGGWEWVATLPENVLGYAPGNFMNEAMALGLYCVVSKILPGSELPFPGSKANYFTFNCWTSANLHAKFCLWAAKAPGAGNQIFNVMNGDTESFQNLWPRLASRFGCRIPDPMFPHGGTPGTQGFKAYDSSTIRLQNIPLLKSAAAALGLSADPILENPPTLFLQIDPEKWAKRADVSTAWAILRNKYGLDQRAWEKATWSFLTTTLGRDWSCVGSMSKARKLGWTGYADTWEELEETFQVLEREGVLPPVDQLKADF
ncbi:hypothetical protein N7468_005533 [Penicillium chermesinum]|uniref:PRISE-like Rossmann-fold domain-containing protein n=1 Tax=Penicillium chermesinum TaxID=63820 RepID=A0A9W9NZH1_9EURO|nr:uncharacterized protein N7468_005533 [Penicillium chermesinum]KAJ5232577.1 hypothetical protein N7468_005533 [Penicillium chermesinum]